MGECICVVFVTCECVSVWVLQCVSFVVCGCFDNCVGVLVICVLLFIAFCVGFFKYIYSCLSLV